MDGRFTFTDFLTTCDTDVWLQRPGLWDTNDGFNNTTFLPSHLYKRLSDRLIHVPYKHAVSTASLLRYGCGLGKKSTDYFTRRHHRLGEDGERSRTIHAHRPASRPELSLWRTTGGETACAIRTTDPATIALPLLLLRPPPPPHKGCPHPLTYIYTFTIV